MWRSVALAAAFAMAFGCWKPPAPPPAAEPGETSTGTLTDYLSALSWLAGGWSSSKDGVQVSEEWVQVHPRLMLGSNRTVIDGQPGFHYEHLEIWARGDDLVYRAKRQDQPAVELVLVELAEHLAAFENTAHDFPRRIVYKREGDEIEVSISGQRDGEPVERSYIWERQPEEGPRDYILKSVAVDAPADQVFQAFVDAEQATTFFAPAAKIEPRIDGAYEMYFMPDAPEGSRGTEGCTVVEISPPNLLAVTWNFPPEIPTLRHAHTLVTIQVSPFDGDRARVDLKQMGFRSGPDWDEGQAYFERAWGIVLDRLQRRFKSGPFDWSE